MEQARHLNKLYLLAPPPPPVSTYGDSWEEQAFAEDAAGVLGGCVWPPRSYSCSFCRREFRSAQALGGHMNVHRRDRARLKQSPSITSPPPPAQVVPHHQNHVVNAHHVSFDANPFSPHHFVYNNPNSEIRVSSPPTIHKEEKNSTLSFFSPIFQTNHVSHTIQSPPPSWSSFVSKKRDRFGLNLVRDNLEKQATSLLTDSRAEKDDCVTEDHLSVNLNLVVCEAKTKASYDEEVASFKRRKIEANPLSLLPNLSGMEKCNLVHQSEDLDLELRLGDAPKVK